jgi:hypothetical protein
MNDINQSDSGFSTFAWGDGFAPWTQQAETAVPVNYSPEVLGKSAVAHTYRKFN